MNSIENIYSIIGSAINAHMHKFTFIIVYYIAVSFVEFDPISVPHIMFHWVILLVSMTMFFIKEDK